MKPQQLSIHFQSKAISRMPRGRRPQPRGQVAAAPTGHQQVTQQEEDDPRAKRPHQGGSPGNEERRKTPRTLEPNVHSSIVSHGSKEPPEGAAARMTVEEGKNAEGGHPKEGQNKYVEIFDMLGPWLQKNSPPILHPFIPNPEVNREQPSRHH